MSRYASVSPTLAVSAQALDATPDRKLDGATRGGELASLWRQATIRYGSLVAMARVIARRGEDPYDLCHSALARLAASRRLPSWSGAPHFDAIFRRVLLCTAIDRRRQRAHELREWIEVEADPDPIDLTLDLRAEVERLRAMRPRIAEVLTRCVTRHETPSEAARSLGVPGRTARRWCRLALTRVEHR